MYEADTIATKRIQNGHNWKPRKIPSEEPSWKMWEFWIQMKKVLKVAKFTHIQWTQISSLLLGLGTNLLLVSSLRMFPFDWQDNC